jgi:signal transduction histidine kinase
MKRTNVRADNDIARIFLYGFGFMIVAYVVDGIIDSVVREESLHKQLFFPVPEEIFIRMGFAAVLLLFTIFVLALTLKRRRLEATLERKARELSATNRELEAFSSSLTHDIRKYLAQIHAAAQILQEDPTANNDGVLAEVIYKSCQNMESLIKDMLVLAGITRSDIRRERVDLGEIADQVATELLLAEPERSVKVICAPGLVAEGDPNLLKIALYNLIGNAWKYTRTVSEARIEFGMVERHGKKAFFVSDNGLGFDMSEAGHLFEPFQRLPNAKGFPGTGIGLATVQRIIQRHGGEVWGEGESGKGATFFFTLPA